LWCKKGRSCNITRGRGCRGGEGGEGVDHYLSRLKLEGKGGESKSKNLLSGEKRRKIPMFIKPMEERK